MTIAFFTEMGFVGKVPRTHDNMRTEFAWMVALDAVHYSINSNLQENFDLGVVIIPKQNPSFNLDQIKSRCKKVAIMQEGPQWGFQDYTLSDQVQYYNCLQEADIIYTHNLVDKKYYEGLTKHSDVRVLPSLMIEESIGEVKDVERDGVIIGGNFVSWYGGFDSYVVAREVTDHVYAPSMGRKKDGEEQLLTHLPYLKWKDWIHKLNEFKIGVHLMKTYAAGTFALNCSYLGIPCIGYQDLDTQRILHPELTVKQGDLLSARKLIRKLKEDKEFYAECSKSTKELYLNNYNEKLFVEKFYNGR